MGNTEEKLEQIMALFRPSLQTTTACRAATFSAISEDPENVKLVALHDHVQKAEVALLQAQEILFQLKWKGRKKE